MLTIEPELEECRAVRIPCRIVFLASTEVSRGRSLGKIKKNIKNDKDIDDVDVAVIIETLYVLYSNIILI